MTKRDIFFKIAFYIILSILFVVSAAIVILFAAGYKIDIKNRELVQTGIIIIETADNMGEIFIDGELIGQGKIIERNLTPGFYDVEVKEENYQSYEEKFYLEAGEAKILDRVTLFLQNPKVEEFTEKENVLFNRLADTQNISISGRELYLNGKFLTRFENAIQDASWYPINGLIGITINDKFGIIDISTLHIFPLFEKKSDKPVVFINSGKTALFESDGKLYTAQIR